MGLGTFTFQFKAPMDIPQCRGMLGACELVGSSGLRVCGESVGLQLQGVGVIMSPSHSLTRS